MKRVVVGAVLALVLSGVAVAITPRPLQDGILDALCAGLGKDSDLWWVLGCGFLDSGGGPATTARNRF